MAPLAADSNQVAQSQAAKEPGSGDRNRIALGVVALSAFVLGFWQLRNAIRLPFVLPEPKAEEQVAVREAGAGTPEPSRTRDTDGDGLMDWDEANRYRTSPYLKDTDSDGFEDKTEIESGNDPNCPKGETCRQVPAAPGESSLAPVEGVTIPTPTAAQIRVLLRKAGATDQDLARYDDASLLSAYQQLAGGTGTASQPAATPAPGGTPSSGSEATQPKVLTPAEKDILRKMSGPEIRNFLIKGGADAKLLQQFDDATLKALVEQQLAS